MPVHHGRGQIRFTGSLLESSGGSLFATAEAGGEASLKSRETDVDDEENRRLKSAVASLCLDNELLREKIARLENGRPLTGWKSRL